MGLVAYSDRKGKLDRKQEIDLREQRPPRDRNEVCNTILKLYGVEYSCADAAKSMHRPGFEYVKPKSLPLKANREVQEGFIKHCEAR